MEEEIVLPRKGDILFGDSVPASGSSAHINITWADPEIGYTEGYRRGARLLVEHVVESQRDQDYLVYPIVFLYRHHIELALKNLILRAPYLMGRSLTSTEEKHRSRSHSLEVLWKDLKPMLTTICKAAGWNKPDAADVEGIDSYIRQLTLLDANSYSFRYVHSTDGKPLLPPGLKYIDLGHFSEMLERLADYFDALDTSLTVLGEDKMEMEAWRSSYGDYA